jgi:hypothetical protein
LDKTAFGYSGWTDYLGGELGCYYSLNTCVSFPWIFSSINEVWPYYIFTWIVSLYGQFWLFFYYSFKLIVLRDGFLFSISLFSC